MSKTKLNENIDKFFKNHDIGDITESTVKHDLNIKETNDYGNILHAIINYKYPEEAVLKTIGILLDLGVDPNVTGKLTGMTFIHLSFYGYTDDKGNDHSYTDNFIIKLIKLAVSHGFDINIKDSDNENIVASSIASEVYTGSIVNIIKSLGPDFDFTDLKDVYNTYLEESKGNSTWNKRLKNELEAVFKLIDASNLSLEEIDENILNATTSLVEKTSSLNYETLKQNYEYLSTLISELISLLKKREIFDTNKTESHKRISASISSISNILSQEIEDMRKTPSTKRIEEIKPILKEFLLDELISEVVSLESDYHNYQESLKSSARKQNTIHACKEFLKSIKGNEIEGELGEIISSIMSSLYELIDNLKSIQEEKRSSFDLIAKYINEEYEDDYLDYESLTEKEIKRKISTTKSEITSYKSHILEYLSSVFNETLKDINPLISNGIITSNDISACFNERLNVYSVGETNDYGKRRK